MSVLSPPPARPAPLDPQALRLVLFGMPDAGKSSLLGALAQAAETQERVLHGNLRDLTQGLDELRKRVYEDRQRETLEEIVPYPVRFSPFGQPSIPAILFDCDGRAANALLTQKRSIEKENRTGTLAGAVLSADGLILTVDASAPHSQIEDDFREFLRFLRFLEKYRSQEHAVGGLPVYLVLTKCDLLVRDASISQAMWEARIEERKKDVMGRFKQFLAGHGVRHGQLSFGTLDLEVRATAVRRPALTDASPQPREPFGVAELFHTAFEEAMAFRDRQQRSRKRLMWTVGGAGTFLAAMLIAGVALLSMPQRTTEFTLADRVESLRASEGPTAATRLGPNLDRRMREWVEVQSHPAFPQLPAELQALVQQRLAEGNAYIQFRDELAAIPPPGRARSLAELSQTQARLTKLIPPEQYAGDWAPTEAAQQRERLLNKDIPALRSAVARLTQFYFTLKNRATVLLQTEELNAEWEQRVRDLAAAEKSLPFPESDPIQGPAYEYDDVAIAEADWQSARDRVQLVRDMAAALGMLGDSSKAPLAFGPPPADADIPALGAARWQQLKTEYPNHAKWSLSAVPDSVRLEFERRLNRSLDQAIRDGQRVILELLHETTTGKKEMPADWARVGENLLKPSLRDWRDLIAFVARLADPTAGSPVETTAAFLKKSSFELDPKQIRIRIPDTLSDAPVRPAGELLLVHRKRDGDETTRVTLRQAGDPQRDKQSLLYTFTATGNAAITYRPGDTFFAELPMRKGGRDLKLTWASSRTLAFQFERLLREPRLHEPEQSNVEGLLAVGVTVTVTDGQFPTVPPMVPIVRWEK
jgi:GTPase SAR1 family protein